RRMLVAFLMLALAGGGFYAVWTYQPEFRAIAQPQIDRLLALAGMALPPAPATTAAPAPVQPAATPGTVVAPPTSRATATAAPVVSKPEPNKLSETKPSETKPSDSKKDATVATSSGAQLPGESSAIVLSSKGAENRLAYSVAPKYPVEARSGAAEE